MASLKQGLKQMLIQRQHRLYEKELTAKNLTYDAWIRQQEQKVNIPTFPFINSKRLTNELAAVDCGKNHDKSEINNSENGNYIQIMEISDENGQYFREKMKLLYMPVSFLSEKTEGFLEQYQPDAVVLSVYPGEMSRLAVPLICREFENHKETLVIYGDEDTLAVSERERKKSEARAEEKARVNPWFKPDWSPDRFLSSFYFGGLVAVRAEELRKAVGKAGRKFPVKTEDIETSAVSEEEKEEATGTKGAKDAKAAAWLYELLFEILKDTRAFAAGCTHQELPVCHIRQVLFHSKKGGYEQIKHLRLSDRALEEHFRVQTGTGFYGEKRPLLSVIIPSKDNLEALFQCMDSLLEKTQTAYPVEIILVDNGSRDENRQIVMRSVRRLNEQKKRLKNINLINCEYLYEVMPFNFSKMCNLGAERAKGELFLFLNDDMEIIEPYWLDKLADKAVLSYAGAVGAKLLYPHSDIIQHAGITNLRVGPAHKLQFLSDAEEHYFGMNRGVHNMLAVTGACLMVRRDVFLKARGFNEELAVAFNDVDLCYTIFENGYYNIERNDTALYHHESLSRGNDGESSEKQLRLLAEKDKLYERHQQIYGKDPFYHPYLTTDMLEQEYSPAYRYQVTLDMPWADIALDSGEAAKAREDKCLVVGMECAMDIYKWKYGVSVEYAMSGSAKNNKKHLPENENKISPEDTGYYFQGYSFVIGADNACYKKKLLLKNKENGMVWQIPVDARYRQDIKNNLHDQVNVDLTGFAAKLKKNTVPAGVYQFGMLAQDQCSRQRLVNWSNWVLEVTADGKS